MSGATEDVRQEIQGDVGGVSQARGSRLDRVTRNLVVASAIAIVLVLGVTTAVVYYSAQVSKIPRTAVERDFVVAREAARLKPKDAQAWAMYASAAVTAGKYDDASTAIAGLEKLTKRSIVLLIKGDLASAKGDLSGARTYYEKAAVQAAKDYDADIEAANVQPSAMGPSKSEIQAYVALGGLDMRLKDYRAAVTHFQAALKLDPNAADSLAALGDAQAASGDEASAASSYRKALQFVPDYPAAVQGLKRLEGGR